jgi:hypothetical protein
MTIQPLQWNGPGVRVRSRQLGWACGAAEIILRSPLQETGPGFAVARSCGTGSSSLNADVNAFDRLHMVQDSNSSCCGETELVDAPRQVFRNLQILLNECPVDHQLCRRCGQLLGSPAFHLPPHRLEVTLHPINANR